MRKIIYNIENIKNSLQCIKKAKLFQSVAEGICQLYVVWWSVHVLLTKKDLIFPTKQDVGSCSGSIAMMEFNRLN